MTNVSKPLPMPKRGEIWWINFDPSVGGEIKKTRPAIIISNNISNKTLNRVQVMPVTSNTEVVYPTECLIQIQGKQSKAMADQLTTISKLRLVSKIGIATAESMDDIERVILLQLGIRHAIS